MFRSAVLAVLAVALSSSAAAAQSLVLEGEALRELVGRPVIEASSLITVAPATDAQPDRPVRSERGPWWATTIAVAGPIADGLSTMYALRQSGPARTVREGNGFYQHLFGSDVTAGEIMGFKVGQAAVMGLVTHFAPKERRAQVLLNVIVGGVIHSVVTMQNVRLGARAARDNRAAVVGR